MDRKELLIEYSRLNNSFKKTLVFRIGESAGFFSEYNCMLFAMLYCLEHKIRFVLYSENSNFMYNCGWEDYFKPFCEETHAWYHKYLNMRPRRLTLSRNMNVMKWQFKGVFYNVCAQLIKPFLPFAYYTQDLWPKFINHEVVNKKYLIPELDVDGDIIAALNIMAQISWKFNSSTRIAVDNIINELNIPTVYNSCHIRRGDKTLEADYVSKDDYIRVLNGSSIRNIFVLTDDYKVIEELSADYPMYEWYTLCDKRSEERRVGKEC